MLVYRSGAPTITSNTITGTDNGILVTGVTPGSPPEPVVTGNAIYSNTRNFVATDFLRSRAT